VVAVVTNSMMVGFTSTVLVRDMDLFEHISSRYQEAGLWVCVMAMEHVLLLAKVLLMMFVPDGARRLTMQPNPTQCNAAQYNAMQRNARAAQLLCVATVVCGAWR
jgi:hypothetical protein